MSDRNKNKQNNRHNPDRPMTVKQLKQALADYPDDMEVVLFRPECEDCEEYSDPDFDIAINDNGQLEID